MFFGSASKIFFRFLLNIAIGIFYQAVAGEETDSVVVGDQKVCGPHIPIMGKKVNLKQNIEASNSRRNNQTESNFSHTFLT